MTRVIKFRAWDGYSMLKDVQTWTDDFTDMLNETFKMWANPELSQHLKLMQFTGLLDKNGKEIYENDVVKILYTDWVDQSNYSIGKVVFEEDRYWVSIYSKKYGEYCLSPIYPGKYGWIEVIGNIYENGDAK